MNGSAVNGEQSSPVATQWSKAVSGLKSPRNAEAANGGALIVAVEIGTVLIAALKGRKNAMVAIGIAPIVPRTGRREHAHATSRIRMPIEVTGVPIAATAAGPSAEIATAAIPIVNAIALTVMDGAMVARQSAGVIGAKTG
ncbi:hypothetical protein [Altererythrobacter sp. MF3-039]|uniref:hypothetical protein n=1 Tax=Altererythrobacter sp. MF3-039 TaxID=3252901 RepID=UPI00390CD51B